MLSNLPTFGRKALGLTQQDNKPFNVSFDRLPPGLPYDDIDATCFG